MSNPEFMYSKNSIALMRIARDLYCSNKGDQTKKISDYAEEMELGRGTVQKAVKDLEDSGCVQLRARGHQGTVIEKIKKKDLWRYTGWNVLAVTCPFPGSHNMKVRSLVASIDSILRESGIPYVLSFSPATHNRMTLMENNYCSIGIIPILAMDVSGKKFRKLKNVLTLNGCIYSDSFALFQKKGGKGLHDGMKLAINIRSAEQGFFAEKLKEQYQIEPVEMLNTEAAIALKNDDVDAMLCRITDFSTLVDNQDEYEYIDLDYLGYDYLENVPSLVINKDNYGMEKLVNQIFDPQEVERRQQNILTGRESPTLW